MRIPTMGMLAAVVLAVPLAGAALAQATDVAVVDNAYEPPSLTVTAGETVTWTSSGSNPHTVTSDDGSFDSNAACNGFADSAAGSCMDNGESYEHAFDEPGTYPYYCKLHGAAGGQGMAGTIVVEAAASDGGTTDGGDTTGGTTDGSAETESQDEATEAGGDALAETGSSTAVTLLLGSLIVVAGGVLLRVGSKRM